MAIDPDLRIDRQIASLMPRAWPVFFSRYGRLTAVQRKAIPRIMRGNDILLCSATASGKTEAVCAPLVERNIDRPTPWKILYVTPTRALVNDLYSRLLHPLSELGLLVARRTGDHRDTGRLAHIILTTPESFDSLLCRGKTERGHILADTVAVVLDEIHLLYGSARGEQVRWLLHRLKRLKQQAVKKGWSRNKHIQVVGLSATINQPESVINAFIPGGEAVVVEGKREIECVASPEVPQELADALLSYLDQQPDKEKILVFCNSRKRVDYLAYFMREQLCHKGYEILAHHGSLSQHIREQAEETARKTDAIIIFATSTLELGIDIGDIDLIVLDGPAPSVSDLLQRIGRGNRRTDKTRVLFCAGSKRDALVNTAMLEAARNGYLGDTVTGPNYAVARQQVASYILQAPHGYRSAAKVKGLIDECLPNQALQGLIETLVNEGELCRDHDRIRLGRYWLDRTGTGFIHSNIENRGGYQVIDAKSGERIATGVRYTRGKGLKTGGKKLQVQGVEVNRLLVSKQNKAHEEAVWGYVASGTPDSSNQAQAVRYYLNIPYHVWPVVYGEKETLVFHFGGRQIQILINMLHKAAGLKAYSEITESHEMFVSFEGRVTEKPDWLKDISAAGLHRDIVSNLNSLENRLSRPAANKILPLQARIEEVKGWLGVKQGVERIIGAVWLPSDSALYKAEDGGRNRVVWGSLLAD